jgi:hypothetical protein
MSRASGLGGIGEGHFWWGCGIFDGQAGRFFGVRGAWRNEANLRGKWLSWHGGWRFGGLEFL